MSGKTKTNDMFVFSLAALLGILMCCLRYVEIYFFGVGQPVIQSEAQRFIRYSIPYTALLIAATVIAAVNVYTNEGAASGDAYLNEETNHGYSTEESDGNIQNRLLAGSYANNEPNDWPMILILVAHFLRWIVFVTSVLFCFPSGGRHKEIMLVKNFCCS